MNSIPNVFIDTRTVEKYKTIILTVISRATEAASVILDQTGIVQVNRYELY